MASWEPLMGLCGHLIQGSNRRTQRSSDAATGLFIGSRPAMAYRRITVYPEQPDSLPTVSRRVLPLSVSPAQRRAIEEGQKPGCGEPGSSDADERKGESSAAED